MQLRELCVVALLAASCPATASVTLGFSIETVSGLANSAGVPSNDLYYGVIVDAGGNGFLGAYQGITLALDSVYILNDGISSAATDDVLITAKFLTYDAGAGLAGFTMSGRSTF